MSETSNSETTIREIKLTDSDITSYVLRDESLPKDVIRFMYDTGVIKSGHPVECSRWGVSFEAVESPGIDDKTVAIHEAGHAIVLMELGSKFRYAELCNDKEARGRMEKVAIKELGRNDSPEYWKHSDADAIAVAGGPIATSRFLNGSSTHWREGGLDDFILLCLLEMQNSYKEVEFMVNRAADLVESRWNVVKAIADHLLKYRRVRYSQCMRIRDKSMA